MILCPDCGDPIDYIYEDPSGLPVYECANPSHKKPGFFRLEGKNLLRLSFKEVDQLRGALRIPGDILPPIHDVQIVSVEKFPAEERRTTKDRLLDPMVSRISERLVPYFRATLHIDAHIVPHGISRKKPRVFDPMCEWNIEPNTGVEWGDVEFFARAVGKSAAQVEEKEVIYSTENHSYPSVCRRLVLSEGFKSILMSEDLLSMAMRKPGTIREHIQAYIASCGFEDREPLSKLEKESSDVSWRWWISRFFKQQETEDWSIGVNPPMYVIKEYYLDSEKRPKRGCYTVGSECEDTDTLLASDPRTRDVPSSDERRRIAKILRDSLPVDIGGMRIFEENLRRLRQEIDSPVSHIEEYDSYFVETMKEKGMVTVLSDGLVVTARGVSDYEIDGEIERCLRVTLNLVKEWLDTEVR